MYKEAVESYQCPESIASHDQRLLQTRTESIGAALQNHGFDPLLISNRGINEIASCHEVDFSRITVPELEKILPDLAHALNLPPEYIRLNVGHEALSISNRLLLPDFMAHLSRVKPPSTDNSPTAILGYKERTCYTLPISPDQNRNILISGSTAEERAMLLATLALTTTASAKPKDVQMFIFDYSEEQHLQHLQSVPHVHSFVPRDHDQVYTNSGRVLDIVEARIHDADPSWPTPAILVLIHEAESLLSDAGKTVKTDLFRIAQAAAETNVHLILATSNPSANIANGLFDNMFKANFPIRIAGNQNPSLTYAALGTCIPNAYKVNLDELSRFGDYLIAADGEINRFTCPFAREKDVQEIIHQISRN